MLRIYLTRHGETQWNILRKMQGRKDSDLTDLGVKQAELLSKRLKDTEFDAIYSSSSGRAAKTAQIIKGNRVMEVILRDELMEIHLADWQGKEADEVEKLYPKEFHEFWHLPHQYNRSAGENFYDVQERAVAFINELAKKHDEGNILLVTHTVVVKAILAYYEEREMKTLWDEPFIRQTSLSMIEVEDNKFNVCLHGDISHYEDFEMAGW